MNMTGLLHWVERLNLLLALAVVFAAHLVFYLLINEEDWLLATVAATAVYGLVLAFAKTLARRKKGVR